MRKLILTCDRCKKEVDSLSEVAAGLRSIRYGSHGASTYEITGPIPQEWCLECCREVGFITPTYGEKKEQPQEIAVPTLEDLIREMIRIEIENR